MVRTDARPQKLKQPIAVDGVGATLTATAKLNTPPPERRWLQITAQRDTKFNKTWRK
jgi:hypothetical protein